MEPMRASVTWMLAGVILAGAVAGCGSASSPAASLGPPSAALTAQPAPTVPPTDAPPTPSPTPEATPTPIVVPTDSPAGLTALRLRLKNWLNGSISVPASKLWKDSNTYKLNADFITPPSFILNLTPSNYWQHEHWVVGFQGYVLGTEMVEDVGGVEHVVVYLGQEDGRGSRYYVPVNLGSFSPAHTVTFEQDPGRRTGGGVSPGLTAEFPNPEARAVLDRLLNDTVVFAVDASGNLPSPIPAGLEEAPASDELSLQFAQFGLLSSTGSYTSAMAKYPLVKAMINHEVAVLDPAELLYGYYFSVPISGLYNPSRLPVTVTSAGGWSDYFVLAPGVYTVNYTASGTCDFNPSVVILGSVSIPVVHQSVDSQQVSGSVSMTVQKIGRYLLDPGSTGCDWSVTISQP